MIGMFMKRAADMSYQQLIMTRALQGEPVSRFMRPNPVTVPPGITVRELIEDYMYRYHYKMFPVTEGERLIGCISTRQVKELPREEWERTPVSAVMEQRSADNCIPPDADATKALARMNQSRVSRLMVVSGDNLLGIVTLKDLLQFLSLKIELEENGK